jgi:MscS family membrane protein
MSRPRAIYLSFLSFFVLTVFCFPSQAKPSHIKIANEVALNDGLGVLPKDLDRSTPRRSWKAFLDYCKKDQFATAAHLLNLKAYPASNHKDKGSVIANKLYRLVTSTPQKDTNLLSDNPVGPIKGDRPQNYVVAATFSGESGDVNEIWLQRTLNQKTTKEVWVVSSTSISGIPALYERIVEGKAALAKVKVINQGLGPIPDNFDLSNPRTAATLFRKLTNEGNYADAARLLDLSELSVQKQKEEGQHIARRLALLLQRLLPGSFDRLSRKVNGADESGVPSNEDVVTTAKVDADAVQIRLMRIRRQNAKPVWVFSAKTVVEIPALYAKIGYGWAGDYLPTVFFRVQMWDIQLWQAIGLLVSLILAWILGVIASAFARRWLLWLARKSKNDWDDALVAAGRGPIAMLFFALGFLIISSLLALADGPQGVVLRLLKMLAILGVGWYLVRLIDVAADLLMQIFRNRDDDMGLSMVPVARRILKPVMIVLVVLLGLQNLGMNVTGLLAGLGIGGLALAMASKSTVENMLGGITIAFDRPFKVGDTIKTGSFRGSVEEVGLRSTRIRTANRTLVTLPNGRLADSHIENFAERDKLRHAFTIGLQYDTSMDQVRYVIDEVKRFLYSRDDISDGFSVRFSTLADSSVNVDVVHYVATEAWGEFTAAREEILMEVSEIVGRAGAEFAYPSQTLYTGKAADADSDKAKGASAAVAERRADGTLCIPEIPEKVANELKPSAA